MLLTVNIDSKTVRSLCLTRILFDASLKRCCGASTAAFGWMAGHCMNFIGQPFCKLLKVSWMTCVKAYLGHEEAGFHEERGSHGRGDESWSLPWQDR